MKRRAAYAVTIRCEPGGHWLAGVYRARCGLRIEFAAGRLLDAGTFQPFAVAAEDGAPITDMPLWEGQNGDPVWFRCRCSRQTLAADRGEILDAVSAGQHRVITAEPTWALRESPHTPG